MTVLRIDASRLKSWMSTEPLRPSLLFPANTPPALEYDCCKLRTNYGMALKFPNNKSGTKGELSVCAGDWSRVWVKRFCVAVNCEQAIGRITDEMQNISENISTSGYSCFMGSSEIFSHLHFFLGLRLKSRFYQFASCQNFWSRNL